MVALEVVAEVEVVAAVVVAVVVEVVGVVDLQVVVLEGGVEVVGEATGLHQTTHDHIMVQME